MSAILEKLRGGALASLKMAEAPVEQLFWGSALLGFWTLSCLILRLVGTVSGLASIPSYPLNIDVKPTTIRVSGFALTTS